MCKQEYVTYHKPKGGKLEGPGQTDLQWSAKEVLFCLSPQRVSGAVPEQAAESVHSLSLPQCLNRRWCPAKQLKSSLIQDLKVNLLLA